MSQMLTENKVIGCIQGVAIGDALAAPYEGGILERGVWQLIQLFSTKTLYTDDTQTTLDVIHSIIEKQHIDPDDIAKKMANSYTWFKGYGVNSAKILKKIRAGADWRQLKEAAFKGGSFGNGAAIRACPIGLYFSANLADPKFVTTNKTVASITHGHPLGVHGAYLIAYTTALIINQTDKIQLIEHLTQCSKDNAYHHKLMAASQWLKQNETPNIQDIRQTLGNGVSALESVVSAIYLALSHQEQPIETLIRKCIELKGDTDSIASMACGLWGAHNGQERIPVDLFGKIENAQKINDVAKQLFLMLSK